VGGQIGGIKKRRCKDTKKEKDDGGVKFVSQQPPAPSTVMTKKGRKKGTRIPKAWKVVPR